MCWINSQDCVLHPFTFNRIAVGVRIVPTHMFLDAETRALNQTEAEANEEEIRKRCEFKARPVHIVGEDWQTIQERQAVRRKQRAQIRKEQVGNLHE